jgi:2-polyprenyl-3-methyl-5-hydroxy-6-metoxy-1,4-benzoquinol methylase
VIELAECPACGSPAEGLASVFRSERSIVGTRFPSRIVRCGCRHHFLNPQPTWDEVESIYDTRYYDHSETFNGDSPAGPAAVGGRFNHVPVLPGGRFLDVGCGTGGLIAAMARLGMQAEGVEPSRAAVGVARAAGLKVACGMLHEAGHPDDAFDRVSLFHVLEHTPDPVTVLRECRRVLKPGGVLVVGVPNFDSLVFSVVGDGWVGLQLPTHFQHFSPDSLAAAAERAGLRPLEVTTESRPGDVESELARYLRSRFLVPERLTRRTRITLPLARWLARRGEATRRGESIVAHLG